MRIILFPLAKIKKKSGGDCRSFEEKKTRKSRTFSSNFKTVGNKTDFMPLACHGPSDFSTQIFETFINPCKSLHYVAKVYGFKDLKSSFEKQDRVLCACTLFPSDFRLIGLHAALIKKGSGSIFFVRTIRCEILIFSQKL